MKLTQAELTFLLKLLDQVNVAGLENKAAVVSIMTKIAAEIKTPKLPPLNNNNGKKK